MIFDAKLKEERDYWLKRLEGITAATVLEPDYHTIGVRPPADDAPLSPAGSGERRLRGRLDYCFDAALNPDLRRLTNSSPFLLYTLLVSGLKACLRHYTGAA